MLWSRATVNHPTHACKTWNGKLLVYADRPPVHRQGRACAVKEETSHWLLWLFLSDRLYHPTHRPSLRGLCHQYTRWVGLPDHNVLLFLLLLLCCLGIHSSVPDGSLGQSLGWKDSRSWVQNQFGFNFSEFFISELRSA